MNEWRNVWCSKNLNLLLNSYSSSSSSSSEECLWNRRPWSGVGFIKWWNKIFHLSWNSNLPKWHTRYRAAELPIHCVRIRGKTPFSTWTCVKNCLVITFLGEFLNFWKYISTNSSRSDCGTHLVLFVLTMADQSIFNEDEYFDAEQSVIVPAGPNSPAIIDIPSAPSAP